MIDISTILIPGENPVQLQQLADSLMETLHPADSMQEIFVGQIVHHTWQIQRFRKIESLIWAKAATSGCADLDEAYDKTEKKVAGIHKLIASLERCISRASRDLERLVRQASRPVAQKPKVGQALSPVHLEIAEQTQFEEEMASWPKPQEEEQTQYEYPPVPKGANEAQFPTDEMRRVADWRLYRKK